MLVKGQIVLYLWKNTVTLTVISNHGRTSVMQTQQTVQLEANIVMMKLICNNLGV